MSQVFRDALRSAIDSENPEHAAVKLDMERSKIKTEIKALTKKQKAIEKRAKEIFGMSLDDFLETKKSTKSERWTDAKKWLRSAIDKNTKKTDYELANLYSYGLKDYSITGGDCLKIVQELRKEIESEGMYQ